MVWDECNLVYERENLHHITHAVLQQATISSIMSEKGGQLFNNTINRMKMKTVPFEPDSRGQIEGLENGVERKP